MSSLAYSDTSRYNLVADTAPLNYLIWIEEVDVLPQLYDRILIPDAVWEELHSDRAPATVKAWRVQRPSWLEILPTSAVLPDEHLDDLDAGERAAILLAENQPGPVLLAIDDAAGRQAAGRRQIRCTGTLGVLFAASLRGLVDLPSAFAQLEQTNFRRPQAVMAKLLAEDAARKRGLAQ